MRRKTKVPISLGLLILVSAIAWICAERRRMDLRDDAGPQVVRDKPATERIAAGQGAVPPSESQKAAAAPVGTTRWTSTALEARIEETLRTLLGKNPEQIREALDELDRALGEAESDLSIGAILKFLASRRDAPTGEPFQIGEGGVLETAPTLRVFLLDRLGVISREAANAAAAAAGREILQASNSSDEWAISLRNVAWSEPASSAFLVSKLDEMLSRNTWLENPTVGFLEAFDVVAYTKATKLLPRLASLVQSERTSLQRAAAVALDRLAEAAPLETMQYLNENPGTLAERPMLRADYFAKADLANPEQRRALESYLARADVAVEEKAKMLNVFAVPGSFVSNNLLTNPIAPDALDPEARVALLRQLAPQWSRRFPALQSTLAELLAAESEP